MALEKHFFPVTSKVVAFLLTLVATTKRMIIVVLYFAPSLGLFDLLHHYQFEQIPFSVRKNRQVKADDVLSLRLIDPIPWTELDRWNYFDDPHNPSPPHYSSYTGLDAGSYFKLFWIILLFHIGSNVALKLLTSKKFRQEANVLDKFIHGLENCNIPSRHGRIWMKRLQRLRST